MLPRRRQIIIYTTAETYSNSGCPIFTGEENKNVHYSNTSNSVSGASRQQASKQIERVKNLKEFHQNFNSTFQPSHSVHSNEDDVQVCCHNSPNEKHNNGLIE